MKPSIKPAPHRITPDDVWADEVRTKCAKAMVVWLKESLNVKRPIDSLKRAELEAMAEAVTSTWIGEAGQRMQQIPPPPNAAELQILLA